MRAVALAIVLGLGLGVLPGCSWLFVDPAPVGHERMRYFDCTSGRAAPVIDTVVAVLYGLSAVINTALVSSAGDSDWLGEDDSLRATMIVLPLGVATAAGFSAAYGYETTSECSEAKARWAARELQPRGCGSDADCRGDRVCEQGACVFIAPPPALPAPAPAAAPAGPASDPTVPAPAPTPTPPASPAPSP